MSIDPAPPHERPRWVVALAAVAGVALLVLIVVMLAGGEHGPGRHSLGHLDAPSRAGSPW